MNSKPTKTVGFVIHDTIRSAGIGSGFHFGKINPYEVLSAVRYELIIKVSLILFITLIVVGIFGVFFLHRVAGPAYRFRQVLLRINEGVVPGAINLREGDFFLEVASEMNKHLEYLAMEEDKKKQIRQTLDKIVLSSSDEDVVKQAKDILSLLS